MVSPEWRMRPVAFKEMWEQFDYEYLPYPISVRPTSPTIDEYAHERIEALEEALKTLTEWYEPALTALSNPQVRVECYGQRKGLPIRIHVGIGDEVACIASQEPGPEPDIGADVTLRAVRAADVGRALAKMLEVASADPAREWRFSAALDNADEQARRRDLDTVMSAGVIGALPVGVSPGAFIDWREDPDTQSFEIVTVRDHGDLIVNKPARQVVSATPERAAKAFDTYVAAVRQIAEQRH